MRFLATVRPTVQQGPIRFPILELTWSEARTRAAQCARSVMPAGPCSSTVTLRRLDLDFTDAHGDPVDLSEVDPECIERTFKVYQI